MVTFTINIPQMLAYIPYMDPMGYKEKTPKFHGFWWSPIFLPWVKSPFFGGHRWPLAAFGGPRLAQVVAERGGLSEALGLRRRELAAWEAAVGAEDPRTDLDGPGGLGTASYPSLFQFYSNFLIYPILYNVCVWLVWGAPPPPNNLGILYSSHFFLPPPQHFFGQST